MATMAMATAAATAGDYLRAATGVTAGVATSVAARIAAVIVLAAEVELRELEAGAARIIAAIIGRLA